ncbi:MAG: DUF2993 domain-containing protein [Limnoraphis sp.]
MHFQSMSSTETSSKPLVGKVLSRAVKLWLRSQVEQIDALDIKISGNNRSILTGHISQVTVWTAYAVYRGLHLSQVDLCASGIEINIGQVLKGKPLKLLKSFPVDCQVCLLSADLNTSLQAPLLTNAITKFLLPLIQSQNLKNCNLSFPNDIKSLQNLQIILGQDQLTLTAEMLSTRDELTPFCFHSELYLASPTELLLASPHLKLPQQQQHYDLDNMTIDLGTDVNLQQLSISPEQLQMKGEIKVNP